MMAMQAKQVASTPGDNDNPYSTGVLGKKLDLGGRPS